MPQSDLDRSLLFGLLALQNGLIDQVQWVAGFQARTRDRSRGLADYLLASGALDAEQRGLLDGLGRTASQAATGEILHRLPAGASTIRCLAIGPDGQSLAAAGDDGAVRIWDAATGKELGRLAITNQPILCLAFSPDGTRLPIGGQERTIKLWDPAAGEAIFTLSGHADGIAALAFSRDGTRLASAGMDHTTPPGSGMRRRCRKTATAPIVRI
jgi:WD40 repeat protein